MIKRGFTLLELIIVIVIIGILAAVALPRYFANIENARRAEAFVTMRALRAADLAQFAKVGSYFAAGAITTWSVDVDSNGVADIVAAPNTTNFTYSAVDIAAGRPYIKATKVTGTTDYYMCVSTGRAGTAVPAAECP